MYNMCNNKNKCCALWKSTAKTAVDTSGSLMIWPNNKKGDGLTQ
jgi:hypothetical protein